MHIFFFKMGNFVMKTLEATNQLGGFNQCLPMSKSNKIYPYSESHQRKDDAIDTLFYSVKYHNGTTVIELIVGTKTILTDVYAIGSKSGLNIANFSQDRFRERGIPIKI